MINLSAHLISKLEQQANEGNAQAQFDLAMCYAEGEGIQRNIELAFEWNQKAAEQGYAKAQLNLGLYYLKLYYSVKDDEPSSQPMYKAVRTFIRNLDEETSPNLIYWPISIIKLSLHKRSENNITLAIDLFNKSAAQDCIEAQYCLAFCYSEGMKVKRNDKLAFKLFKQIADQGYLPAYYQLALCYQEAKGCKKNEQRAFDLFTQLAEHYSDNELFRWHLAFFYFYGKCVEKNIVTALTLFTQIAERSFHSKVAAEACLLLSELYDQGEIVEENKELALTWREKSKRIIFGHNKYATDYKENFKINELEFTEIWSRVNSYLAEFYLKDTSVLTHFILGMNYRLTAIRSGTIFTEELSEDEYQLARMYLYGEGVEEDKELGMEWMLIAAGHGNAEANNWLTNAYIALAVPSCLSDKQGGDQYYQLAADWCLKELDGCNAPEANLLLGVLYYAGKGVKQSDERAIAYFEKAEYITWNESKIQTHTWNEDCEVFGDLTSLWVGICYAQRKNIVTYFSKEKTNCSMHEWMYTAPFHHLHALSGFGKVFVEGIMAMPFCKQKNNKIFLTLLRVFLYKKAGEYDLAKEFTKEVFDKTEGMDKNFKEICLTSIEQEQEIAKQNEMLKSEIKEKNVLHKELQEKNKQLQEKEIELEDMMSMFAHKFRSPLDAIIYNTTHDNQVKLYAEAAQTMRGLLNIFSIISTDDTILKDKIKQDCQGNGQLETVFSKTLDMILLHLLSVSGAEKIQQHYLNYAKTQGQCDAQLSYKTWCEEYFEVEQVLQTQWEADFAQLINQSASLEQRLAWLEQHFFKLEITGFNRADIQFKEYGITESLLTILLNEILVNAFKYYSSTSNQSVLLEWTEREDYQVLICRNPSIRSERSIIKGSHKGHVFLSTLARKTGSLFNKPMPHDAFVLEFGIPNELLISK